METFSVQAGQERLQIRFLVTMTENGISILLTGGEKSHVGGMVLAVPRPSLTGSGISCDAWVIPAPGHKDVALAEPAAALISRATGETVAVTAGIHVDRATGEELAVLEENALEGARLAAERCRKIRGK